MRKTIALLFLVVGVAAVVLGCAMTVDPNGNVSFALVLPTVPSPVVVAEPVIEPVAEPVPEAVVEVPVAEVVPPVVEEWSYGTPVVVAGYTEPFYWECIGLCTTPADMVRVGFVGGVWINEFGVTVVVPEGGWHRPPENILRAHRDMLRRNPDKYHRANAPEHRGQQQHAAPQQHEQKGPQPASQQVKPQEKKASPKQQVKPTQQQQKKDQTKQQVKPQQQPKPKPKCSDADRKQGKCQ